MVISEILKRFRHITVLGISANPERPSHWIALYLQDQGFEVVGVNPAKPEISEIEVVGSLQEIKHPLEIVNVFRSPESIPALVAELIPLQPKVMWLQPGAQNAEAEKEARRAGITVISGPCIYQEHKNL